MNTTNGYKLVPVETLKFALGLTCHGFKNRTDQEADKYAALKTITELLEAPTPPQPIYDEAKERADVLEGLLRRIKSADAIYPGSPLMVAIDAALNPEEGLDRRDMAAKVHLMKREGGGDEQRS